MSQDDSALVRACLDGRKDAWNQLVDRYARLVYSVLNKTRLPSADADDAFQTVFLSLYRNLERLRDHGCVSAWLITTARREAWRMSRLRSKATSLDAAVSEPAELDPDVVARIEQQNLVQQALTELGGQCESLLRALFCDTSEPDYEQISAKLGMPVGSIGPTRARCFKKLERILNDLGIRDGRDIIGPDEA